MIRGLVLMLLLSSTASATDYHVAKTGNDTTGDGLSLGTAWLTIAKGLTVAGASDTLYIHAGVYDEAISTAVSTITGGSSWGTKLTIAGWPGDTVVLRPTSGDRVVFLADVDSSYIELTNLDLDAVNVAIDVVKITWSGTAVNASHHIRISDSTVRNSPKQGILTSGENSTFNEFLRLRVHDNGTDTNVDHGLYISTADNTVSDCDIYNNAATGVHVYYGAPIVHRNQIVNNRIHDNGTAGNTGEGIVLGSGEDNTATGNSIWSNPTGVGVMVFGDSTDAVVQNNWIWNNSTTYLFDADNGIQINPGATGTVSTPNVFAPSFGVRSGTLNAGTIR